MANVILETSSAWDVRIDFPFSSYGYAPDLAIIASGAERNTRGRFHTDGFQ
ncbi:hypothetical protein [Streptomyces sp. NPDC002851]